jgi:hypothetical protein
VTVPPQWPRAAVRQRQSNASWCFDWRRCSCAFAARQRSRPTLLSIQAESLAERRDGCSNVRQQRDPSPRAMMYLPTVRAAAQEGEPDLDRGSSASHHHNDYAAATRTLSYCFLRLADLDSALFDRLGRYEAALWWQTVQILFALGPARQRLDLEPGILGRDVKSTKRNANQRHGFRQQAASRRGAFAAWSSFLFLRHWRGPNCGQNELNSVKEDVSCGIRDVAGLFNRRGGVIRLTTFPRIVSRRSLLRGDSRAEARSAPGKRHAGMNAFGLWRGGPLFVEHRVDRSLGAFFTVRARSPHRTDDVAVDHDRQRARLRKVVHECRRQILA